MTLMKTLAYGGTELITTVKSFTVEAPEFFSNPQ